MNGSGIPGFRSNELCPLYVIHMFPNIAVFAGLIVLVVAFLVILGWILVKIGILRLEDKDKDD